MVPPELIGAMCWPTVERGGAIRGKISSFIKYNTIKEGGKGVIINSNIQQITTVTLLICEKVQLKYYTIDNY